MTAPNMNISQQDAQRLGKQVGERVQQELEQRFKTQTSATAQEVIDATRNLDWGKYIADAVSSATSTERSTSRA